MSLLGRQVYANPTTPIWGQGGGGGGSNPTYTSVSFTPVGTPLASTQIRSDDLEGQGSTLHVMDPDGFVGPLAGTAFYAKGPPGRIIYQADGIDFQDLGSTSYFLATIDTSANRWNLSNIATINGSPPTTGGSITLQDLTMWNPGNIYFYNDASGTAFSVMGIGDTQFSTSNVVVQKQNGQGATLAMGAVQVCGAGNDIDSASLVVLDSSGLSRLTTGGNATFISLAPASDEMDLMNVSTINGSAYPPPAPATYPSNRFTLSNNSGASVLAAGTPVVGIYYEPPANGKVYANANCSFTNPGSNVAPSAGLTVAANLVVSDIVSVPAVASGLNTSASVQWEFGVQAGVAYDFIATATAGVDGDFRANAATLFLSFIPS